MRDYHQKEPRIEPPRDFCTSLGAFVFEGVDVEKEDFAHDYETFLSLGAFLYHFSIGEMAHFWIRSREKPHVSFYRTSIKTQQGTNLSSATRKPNSLDVYLQNSMLPTVFRLISKLTRFSNC